MPDPNQQKKSKEELKAETEAKAKAEAAAKAKAGKSAYTVVDGVDGDINIIRTPGGPDPTPEELAFLGRLDRTDKKIGNLVKHKGQVHPYSAAINAAARIGLNYPVDLRTGIVAMDGIEENFLRAEGPKLRRHFLVSTIRLGATVTVLALLLSIVVALLANLKFASLPWGDMRHIVYVADWIAVGIGVGMIFFAFVNSLNITYDNIGRFDPSGLDPWLRLSLSVVVAVILCVFLKIRIIEIKIGGVELHGFELPTVTGSIICFFIGVFVAATDGVAIRLISATFSSASTKTP